MNRKVCSSILGLCTCLVIGFLTGCGSSSHSTSNTGTTITPVTGYTASAGVGTAFGTLSATVTTNGSPASGVSVTFTAPASGASGTFATTPAAATDTETTNSSGVATSQVFTANSTAGAYTVTASATGATTPASFGLTNTAPTSLTYVYYASGQEATAGTPGYYYAVAGAVTLDSSGDIIGGEQDYNDGVGLTSQGEPSTPDTIAPGTAALAVDPTTGLGTLTMVSSNTSVGSGGTEIFAVQFVNANHALIMQFDGSATSSGSLDLQTATSATGNFAFAASGVNPNYDSVAYGGVFTVGATGTIDINDSDGGVSTGNTFTPAATTPDTYGRSVVTGISDVPLAAPITFVSYTVGPEAMRLIDVDTTDTAVGSAFGQGSATFDNTSLTSDVFTLFGQWDAQYATLGQFTTDTNGDGGIASGTADDNELGNAVQVENTSLLGSTYDLVDSGINGYGSMSLNFQTSEANVSSIGVYMTDPALNLNDPNNTTTDLGGALLADMDGLLPGGIGVITPQTDTTATDFNGSYAAGFQDFNYFAGACGGCEFDMVGPLTMTSGVLSTATIGADDSDPLDTLISAESTGDTYTSTPTAVSPGYFTMAASTTTPPGNPLVGTLNGGATTQNFNVDIYQASATTLYWIDWDNDSVFLGPIEAQPAGTTFPATKRGAARTQAKRK
ncbi:MAG: hypothetical protein WAM13_13520 [Candidatus Sulfotelmatobacter sp.]|jgi:hypothetical protein